MPKSLKSKSKSKTKSTGYLSLVPTERQPVHLFTEKAYLDYSMYVILDRALPHLGDGLKPVQRRIIYAMAELHLLANAKYKKSARTVGDVLGKFHPHSDQACYEAMVLMAQDFSYRYPLVDGQGNWGSADDPKSFAAMRYTEARLTPYAEILLREMDQGTVAWQPNFDGSLEEPILLPAQLPNVLLNGATGIAVGMATDIPPHNLSEIGKALVHLLKNPKATLEDILEFVKGPDYPTGAEIITPIGEINELYRQGYGSIRQRAIFQREEDDIVIIALPYQVSGAKVIEQIATQMQAKKLPMLSDLRDESDHENPTRLVITPRSNRIDFEALMLHLFATTDLEKSYRVNFNMIGIDGRPRVYPLINLLREWLDFRRQTVTQRIQHRLEKIATRLHLLEGFLIAYLNIDEVIKVIREEEEPKQKLMSRFKLSERQAEAILDMKLRHLAKLEEIKIRSEQKELAAEEAILKGILESPKQMTKLLIKEIETNVKQYGDERRSPLVIRTAAAALKEENLQTNEPMTVVLSEKGWIRAGKGHDLDGHTLSYRAGDEFLSQVTTRSTDSVVFMDSAGRSYSVLVHTLPSARSQGEPLTTRLTPAPDAHFVSVLAGEEKSLYLLACDAGYGFLISFGELISKNRNGKTIFNLPKQAKLMMPKLVGALEKQWLAAVTNTGQLLVFPLNDLPELARGKGNKIMQLNTTKDANEYLVDVAILAPDQALQIFSGKRKLTLTLNDLKHYRGTRAQRGRVLPQGYRNVTRLLSI